MKARISKSTSDIILSIGMIVKNEEKYLNKCLSALKPLLDSVSSELVIVDTGSNDRTVKIAQKYTDKVYFFEWVNDFAAARNFGLEKCNGEWFMFLDADDILDRDASELIKFFNDAKMRNKYNSAYYITRDYTNLDGTQWSSFARSRIIRLQPGVRFIHKIHEAFEQIHLPSYEFKTIFHHWGYAHESDEQREEKKQRNLIPLREALRDNSDDLRTYLHILNEYNVEEVDNVLPEVLDIARRLKHNDFAPVAFARAIIHHYSKEELQRTLELINEYFQIFKSSKQVDTFLDLDIYVAKSSALEKLGDLDQAIEAMEKYLELYKLYTANKLNLYGIGLFMSTFNHEEDHLKAKDKYNELLSKAGRIKVSFNMGGSSEKIVAATRAQDDSQLRRLEDSVEGTRVFYYMFDKLSTDNEQGQQEYEEHLERSLKSARRFNTYFSPPLFLIAIKYNIKKNNFSEALSLIDEYTERFKPVDVMYTDLLYYKTEALFKAGRYSETAGAADEYFKLYELCQKGKLERNPTHVMPIECLTEEKSDEVKRFYDEANGIL